jgi:hypothetical protein
MDHIQPLVIHYGQLPQGIITMKESPRMKDEGGRMKKRREDASSD